MAYMEQLQSGFKSLVQAGEAGRHSIDDMVGPVNGAIGEITGAADELTGLPGVPPGVGEKLQRVMRGINAAQSKVGTVLSTYSQATRAMSAIDERMGALKEQAARAGTAINQTVGKVSPSLTNIMPTSALAPNVTPIAEAVKPFPHLLILQPLQTNAQPFYFNLDTAAFNELVGIRSSAGPRRSGLVVDRRSKPWAWERKSSVSKARFSPPSRAG